MNVSKGVIKNGFVLLLWSLRVKPNVYLYPVISWVSCDWLWSWVSVFICFIPTWPWADSSRAVIKSCRRKWDGERELMSRKHGDVMKEFTEKLLPVLDFSWFCSGPHFGWGLTILRQFGLVRVYPNPNSVGQEKYFSGLSQFWNVWPMKTCVCLCSIYKILLIVVILQFDQYDVIYI